MHWAGRTQAVSRHGDRQLQHSPASTLAAWWGGGQPSAWPSSLAWAVIWSMWGKAVTRACPARDRFWCSPGVVQDYLLNGCEWGASPQCVTLTSLGCISKAACAHGLPCCTPWSHCLSSTGCPCASVPGPIQLLLHFPRASVTKLWSRNIFLREMPQMYRAAPRAWSDCAAQGALMAVLMGTRASRKKHHPWRKQQKCSLEQSF